MKFENKYRIIYCKDEYYKKYDNNSFYDKNNIQYYRGYMVHCEDGPAVQLCDGTEGWHLDGIWYTEKEYHRIINLKSKKKVLDDI